MRPRPPLPGRRLRVGTGIIVTGLLATRTTAPAPPAAPATPAGPTPAEPADPGPAPSPAAGPVTVPTRYGPLTATDRAFVTDVRLAGLWELPAGREAELKGAVAAVRTAGRHLVADDVFLAGRVREVAARLRIPLPDRPAGGQRGWLATLHAARGALFDRRFGALLESADDRVFPLAAEIRAGTRNTLVRALADDTDTVVLAHIEALESLVPRPTAAPAPTGTSHTGNSSSVS
jgi:predicted outer membrane protein